ncbi:UPF0176 protein [Carnobacterium iners]|uniref:tRNA uridine(34) hydroxylase n=1 Tax=Carnobacterium iners TaxID=1073423 RepID=A0A1X7NTW7_9LACT|nr:rhodanese-related sulfurtransferase [Carnobacterium iners]SEK88196.1 UPF0176 protein [Carnobacterium iners]SMH40716.1 UPF0176 protein [Carnobacterium iners]
MSKDYRVLLYYQYVTIEKPEQFTTEHLTFCRKIGLKGRILVATEGINGTISGTYEQTQLYMDTMHADKRFADIIFKIDEENISAFKKMHVRYRQELVTLSLEDDINPNELTGTYLEPEEFHKAILDENTIVIDARNNYEYDLGHFRGAVRPEIRTFRELPQWIRENKEKFMDKRIVTYCTGGIRCEKFSGWLLKEGFEDVGQLHGGIATYGKDPEVQGELWDGQMYVFDTRISVPINQKEHVIVGRDWFDGSPCERYVNCANPKCNRKILISEENEYKYLKGCSHECRIAPKNIYVKNNQLNQDEVSERLAAIGEKLPATAL